MKQRNSGGWLAEKSDAGDRIPLGRAVVLHLLPGTLTMGVLLTLTPFLIWAGQSRVLAYQVAVSLVGIPAMVGVMLWHARRTTGSASLATVIRFRKRPPVWMYAAVLVAFLGVRSVLRQCLAPGLPSQGSVRVAAGLPSPILGTAAATGSNVVTGRVGCATADRRNRRARCGGVVFPRLLAAATGVSRGVGAAAEHLPLHRPPLVATLQLGSDLPDHVAASLPGLVEAQRLALGRGALCGQQHSARSSP
jgi:hypothetical protein